MIGNGNVALDVARMLVKHPDELLVTEIPDNVYQALKNSPVTDVHVFSPRASPGQVHAAGTARTLPRPGRRRVHHARRTSSSTRRRTRRSAGTTRSAPWSTL